MSEKAAHFEVEVTASTAQSFAELSGDWNPLHTDAAFAAGTSFGRPILHGAFSAALMSRMAGMHIPGRDCLLRGMRLTFLAPVVPPTRVRVAGELQSESPHGGEVQIIVTDAGTGRLYVRGSYTYGWQDPLVAVESRRDRVSLSGVPAVGGGTLVTGGGGALGTALLTRLGDGGFGFPRTEHGLLDTVEGRAELAARVPHGGLRAVVHCGWPAPDGRGLLETADPASAVERYVAAPLTTVIRLAQLLAEHGQKGAVLVLVGSTAAEPGRHAYRAPFYGLGKSTLPYIGRSLAVELGVRDQRCVTLVLDVLDGGMSAGMSRVARIAHADRSPFGRIPTPDEAAEQIEWVLGNVSRLVSGASISLSGAMLP